MGQKNSKKKCADVICGWSLAQKWIWLVNWKVPFLYWKSIKTWDCHKKKSQQNFIPLHFLTKWHLTSVLFSFYRTTIKVIVSYLFFILCYVQWFSSTGLPREILRNRTWRWGPSLWRSCLPKIYHDDPEYVGIL